LATRGLPRPRGDDAAAETKEASCWMERRRLWGDRLVFLREERTALRVGCSGRMRSERVGWDIVRDGDDDLRGVGRSNYIEEDDGTIFR